MLHDDINLIIIASRRALALLALVAIAAAPASAMDSQSKTFRAMRVGVVVHEGVELLDFAGPAEVFSMASRALRVDEQSWFEVFTVAPSRGPVLANGGVVVEPRYTIADCPPLDVLVIPGGETQLLERDDAFVSWVRDTAPHAKVTMSVCTGAFVLAKAGLLEGREATTHHGSIAGLRDQAKNTRVVTDRRVVDNGSIVTAAGVSAGIDGALHVVAKLLGRKAADIVASNMEYRWQPEPSLEGAYTDWSPLLDERGRGLQEIVADRTRSDWHAAADVAKRLSEARPDDGVAWYELGLALHMQGKIDEAIPVHERAAALPDERPTALYNLGCAWALKGDKEKSLECLGKAVDAGWKRRATAERDSDLDSLRADARFSDLLARMDDPSPPARLRWAEGLFERAKELFATGHADAALGLLDDAAGGAADDDEEVRLALQQALARRDVTPGETTWKARRFLAEHPWSGRVILAPPDEPGDRMVISGIVRDAAGRPVAGAKLHVFHADASGHYTDERGKMDEPNARLNGWIVTGDDGRYEFRSVRPGGYPEPRKDVKIGEGEDAKFIPQHVHFEVEARGHALRRFQLVFQDDPRMTPHRHQWARDQENPVVELQRDASGVLHGACDVTMR